MVGHFDVVAGELLDMGLQDGGGGAVLLGEGIAVGDEVRVVPSGGEEGGEGGKGVGELEGSVGLRVGR